MKPSQVNRLILTVTFCTAFLIWGTITVWRVVIDRNYHTPTAQQQAVNAFKDCTNGAYGNANSQCKDLVK